MAHSTAVPPRLPDPSCWKHTAATRCRRDARCGWRDDLGCQDVGQLMPADRENWERAGRHCKRMRKPDCELETPRCEWVRGRGCRDAPPPPDAASAPTASGAPAASSGHEPPWRRRQRLFRQARELTRSAARQFRSIGDEIRFDQPAALDRTIVMARDFCDELMRIRAAATS